MPPLFVRMADKSARQTRMRRIVRSLGVDQTPPLNPESFSRAAIVTTVKRVSPQSLKEWCSYHLKIGFERLYVYFDEPEERHRVHLTDERIICTPVDQTLLKVRCYQNSAG